MNFLSTPAGVRALARYAGLRPAQSSRKGKGKGSAPFSGDRQGAKLHEEGAKKNKKHFFAPSSCNFAPSRSLLIQQNPHPNLLPAYRAKGPSFRRVALLAFLICFCFASIARAEPVILLPLDGYYRPGKFFPVRVTADRPVDVRIDSPEGIGSRGKGTSLTLPVMVLSPTERAIRVSIDGQATDVPIRALNDADLFVLTTSSRRVEPSHSLPRGGRLLMVGVSADQLGNLDQSYESADRLLVANSDLPRLGDATRRTLLASGVTIATDSPEPPASRWVWRPDNKQMVLDLFVRGPVTSADDVATYDSVADFVPSQPNWVRRTVFLSAVLFSILALASTLLGRRAIYATCAVCMAGLIAGMVFVARQSAVSERTAAVYIPGPLLEQRDEWSFRTSSKIVTDQRQSAGDMTRPIFAGQADDLEMWVEKTQAGWLFHYTLPPGKKLAWVSRQFIPPMESNAAGPAPGWMECVQTDFDPLLRKYYARTGDVYDVPILKTISPPKVFRLRSMGKSNSN